MPAIQPTAPAPTAAKPYMMAGPSANTGPCVTEGTSSKSSKGGPHIRYIPYKKQPAPPKGKAIAIVKRPPPVSKAGRTTDNFLPSTPPECSRQIVPQSELRLKWELENALEIIRTENEARKNFQRVLSALKAEGGLEGWVLHPGKIPDPPEDPDLS